MGIPVYGDFPVNMAAQDRIPSVGQVNQPRRRFNIQENGIAKIKGCHINPKLWGSVWGGCGDV